MTCTAGLFWHCGAARRGRLLLSPILRWAQGLGTLSPQGPGHSPLWASALPGDVAPLLPAVRSWRLGCGWRGSLSDDSASGNSLMTGNLPVRAGSFLRASAVADKPHKGPFRLCWARRGEGQSCSRKVLGSPQNWGPQKFRPPELGFPEQAPPREVPQNEASTE